MCKLALLATSSDMIVWLASMLDMQVTEILLDGELTWPSQRVMFGVGEHSVVYGCYTCPGLARVDSCLCKIRRLC